MPELFKATIDKRAQDAFLRRYTGPKVEEVLKKANTAGGKAGAKVKRAEPEDAVIIYFAGHGTAQGQRFYLLPHDIGYTGDRGALDESGLKTILAHSISDQELEDARVFDEGPVVAAMQRALAGGRAVELAGLHHDGPAARLFEDHGADPDIGQDFEVVARLELERGAGRQALLAEGFQRAEVRRIGAERLPGLLSAVDGMQAFVGFPEIDHEKNRLNLIQCASF
jgi:hypothetical protein